MARKIDGIALGAVATGAVFLYAGLTGRSIPAELQTLVKGGSPQAVSPGASPFAAAITGASGPAGGGGPARNLGPGPNQFIAQAALPYQGHCYVYGGAPGRDGTSCWDCSSFVNWLLAVKLGLPIPGGPYDGTTHGPPTGSWLLWGGVTRISRASVSAGDLCISVTHMGIAISNSEYISAENPSLGTHVDAISTGRFFFFRYTDVSAGGGKR